MNTQQKIVFLLNSKHDSLNKVTVMYFVDIHKCVQLLWNLVVMLVHVVCICGPWFFQLIQVLGDKIVKCGLEQTNEIPFDYYANFRLIYIAYSIVKNKIFHWQLKYY